MKTVVILTGGTSGIGLETAKCLVKAGCTVYEFSRREADLEPIHHIRADVSDEEGIRKAVDLVYEKEGQIDVLINNAGFGISGAFEFTRSEDAHRLLEVNLFGMNNTIRAVLPYMRAASHGRIINLSSVAAVTPIPFQAWYSISKAAVSAMTMALANEVHTFGISVCCVMPGDIRTGFTAARDKSVQGDEVYGGRIAKSVGRMEHDEQTGMEPAVAGAFIARLALKKSPAPSNTIGFTYKLCVLAVRILPGRLVRWILEKMYAN